MKIYYTDVFGDVITEPENEKRVEYPVEHLKKNVNNDIISSSDTDFSDLDVEKFITLTYTKKYFSHIKNLSYKSLLNNFRNKASILKVDKDNDTKFTPLTFESIVGTIKILLQIAEDIHKCENYAYALVRPPGHHSSFDIHSGFCVFNNCYMLANYMVKMYGYKNILIFDWDLHHGDGTQLLVKKNKDKNIYLVSLHGYNGVFYPGTGSEKENCDLVCNIPMKEGADDNIYLDRFSEKAKPFIENIKDKIDLIIVSNGLDAHRDDPMNFLKLTSRSYITMTKYLLGLNKKLVLVLEGGYNPKVIANVSEELISFLNKFN